VTWIAAYSRQAARPTQHNIAPETCTESVVKATNVKSVMVCVDDTPIGAGKAHIGCLGAKDRRRLPTGRLALKVSLVVASVRVTLATHCNRPRDRDRVAAPNVHRRGGIIGTAIPAICAEGYSRAIIDVKREFRARVMPETPRAPGPTQSGNSRGRSASRTQTVGPPVLTS